MSYLLHRCLGQVDPTTGPQTVNAHIHSAAMSSVAGSQQHPDPRTIMELVDNLPIILVHDHGWVRRSQRIPEDDALLLQSID
jgi:hypothetical protein